MPGAGGGLGGAYRPISPSSFLNPYSPPTAPAGAPPPITNAGAYTPDWAKLITEDAGFKDAAAALAAGNAQSQDQLDAQLANAYEAFGPKNVDLSALAKQLGMSAADLQRVFGPDVQKLAQENTAAGLSTSSRLDQANQRAIQQITSNLNKRGLLHSGEAGYQLDRQNLSYRQAQSDAYQKLLSYLQQYQQGYLAAQQANAGHLADAYNSAADRVTGQYQSTPGTTANPAFQNPDGTWVYRDPAGNLYNPDGSAYQQPQQTSGADILANLPSRSSFVGPRVAA